MKKVKSHADVFQFTKLELGMELILLRPALDGLSRKHQRRARLIIDELKLGIQDAESFFPVRGKVHWQQARKALWHLVEVVQAFSKHGDRIDGRSKFDKAIGNRIRNAMDHVIKRWWEAHQPHLAWNGWEADDLDEFFESKNAPAPSSP